MIPSRTLAAPPRKGLGRSRAGGRGRDHQGRGASQHHGPDERRHVAGGHSGIGVHAGAPGSTRDSGTGSRRRHRCTDQRGHRAGDQGGAAHAVSPRRKVSDAPVWVLDTNVLVSGLLSPFGPPGRLVDALLAKTSPDRDRRSHRGRVLRGARAAQTWHTRRPAHGGSGRLPVSSTRSRFALVRFGSARRG